MINEVLALGVMVVVSAGNEGGPVDAPANCVGVAGVAGLRNVGTKVGFSSLGPEISLAAPAGNCINTSGACVYPIDTTSNAGTTTPTINGYTDQLNPSLGTSFSAPIVSGIAALMVSANSNLTAPQIIARLKEGARPFPVSSDTTSPIVMCRRAPRTFRTPSATARRRPAARVWQCAWCAQGGTASDRRDSRARVR